MLLKMGAVSANVANVTEWTYHTPPIQKTFHCNAADSTGKRRSVGSLYVIHTVEKGLARQPRRDSIALVVRGSGRVLVRADVVGEESG